MRFRLLISLFLIGCFLAVPACGRKTSPPKSSVKPQPANLRDTPTQLTVGDSTYKLQASLWRSFTPPLKEPDGRPLIALVRLDESNLQPIHAGVEIDYLWIVHGDQIWETRFSDEDRPRPPAHIFERIAREGPKWGPEVKVDVIVNVAMDGSSVGRLRLPEQMIGKAQ